jgi:hypothetical protein
MSSQVDRPAFRGGVAHTEQAPSRPPRGACPPPQRGRVTASLGIGGRTVPGDVCPGGEQAGRAPRFLPNGIARPQDRTAPRRRSPAPVVVGVLPSDPFATDADELILWDTLGCQNYSSRGIRRLDPSAERRPKHPDLRRSGSYSVPFASAWRERGGTVEFDRDSTPSPGSHNPPRSGGHNQSTILRNGGRIRSAPSSGRRSRRPRGSRLSRTTAIRSRRRAPTRHGPRRPSVRRPPPTGCCGRIARETPRVREG